MEEAVRWGWRIVFWVSLGSTLYTYFLYPALLLVWGRIARRRMTRPEAEKRRQRRQDLPTVTMVVSAYNEEAVLAEKIANCRELDYPAAKLRFLFGSDGSDDATAALLQAAADERIQVVISRQRRGKVAMLNRLMREVDSEIVVFSDANTMYQPGAVRELVHPFADERVGCVVGKLELVTPGQEAAPASDKSGRGGAEHEQTCATEGLYWRYENRIKQWESARGAVAAVNGGIFAVRRALYQLLPEQAVTEDQVLGMQIMAAGYRCVFNVAARAREKVSTWRGELRRRVRISAGNFQSLLLVPGILHPRCGWVSFTFVSHKLLRWLVPFFLAAMLGANVALAGEAFYGSTLLLQGLFYGAGLAGVAAPQLCAVVKLLAIPRYFLLMNAAIVVGLGRFLSGRQQVTWAKGRESR